MVTQLPLSTLAAQDSTSFHPSLGNPGDKLYYFPDNVALWRGSDSLNPEEAAELVKDREYSDGSSLSGHCMVVSVPPSVLHTIFAHRQWRSGMLLADIVYASVVRSPDETPLMDLADKRILELGAGTALPSIVLTLAPPAHAPRQVVITDYDEATLIARLRANLRDNTPPKTTRIDVQGHVWGTNPTDILDLLPCPREVPEPKFDVVFLADCLWDPLSHEDLLFSVTRTLARDASARVYVVSGLHTGRENLVGFIRRALRHGLRVIPWLTLEVSGCEPNGSDPNNSLTHCKLSRASASIDSADIWANVLEAQLAIGVDVEMDVSRLPFPVFGGVANVTVSQGRRLSGVSRPFVLRERPEEKRNVGGVKERNTWIVFWALAWTPEALPSV